MIRLEDTLPGYYWIKIHKGNLNYIHYDNNKWIIVRISREISGKNVLSNIYFPKEDNYGKAKCSFKYFLEKVENNYEGLIPIEEPKI